MKKVFFFLIVIGSLLIINNLVQSIYSLWQKQYLVLNTRRQLDREKEANQKLKAQLVQVTQTDFVEQEARNKLFLVKPGEQVVVVPQESKKTSSAATSGPVIHKPNWQQWLDLFLAR